MKTKLLATIFLLAVFILPATAATKVTKTMTENGITYTLYYALPNDYDSTKVYPLVIGMHYCGGNATDYRTNLIGLCDSLMMIVVCPDNKSQVIPEAQLNMLVTTVDSSKVFYPVDEKQVYLTGMSCNGEFITRHGLNNFYPLKGLFPWDPWITAANPAVYNFDCKIPTVIAVGSDDTNYKSLIAVYDSLKAHRADVDLLIVPNVGHSLFPGFSNEMINCIYYMNGVPDFSFEPVTDCEINNTDSVQIDVTVNNPADKELVYSASVNNKNLVNKVEILSGADKNHFTLKVVANPKYKGNLIVTLKAFDRDKKQLAQGFSNVTIKQLTSTGELTPNDFKIYPMPVKDFIYFTSKEQNLSVNITDLSGKQLLNFDQIDIRTGIQVQDLPKGFYFLIAKGNVTNEKVKFLKL